MNWNGIAPFNQPCEVAPGWPVKKNFVTTKYVAVNGICEVCCNPFSRLVTAGNVSRVLICGKEECKRERASQLKRRNKIQETA